MHPTDEFPSLNFSPANLYAGRVRNCVQKSRQRKGRAKKPEKAAKRRQLAKLEDGVKPRAIFIKIIVCVIEVVGIMKANYQIVIALSLSLSNMSEL
eukprot:scaffold1197_cov46-Attheya_sp.AAC.1